MSNKYELTTNTKRWCGRTLYQIRALRDIEELEVKAGDLGGWIEKIENLSQNENAWVFDKATVCDEARVYGEARVFGNARVYGEARVFGNAWVYGEARIFDKATVCDEARVYGEATVCGEAWVYKQYDHLTVSNIGSRNATTTFMRVKQGGIFVVCGCFTGSIDAFKERVKSVHGDSAHGKAYAAAIVLARAVVNQEPVEEEAGAVLG